MKPQTQKSITLEQITDALANHTLADARALLAPSVGATMTITGTILKIVKRDIFRLVIMANAGSRLMEVYANFTDPVEQQKVIDSRIKKGSTITVAGRFQTFGERAVTMDNCKLEF